MCRSERTPGAPRHSARRRRVRTGRDACCDAATQPGEPESTTSTILSISKCAHLRSAVLTPPTPPAFFSSASTAAASLETLSYRVSADATWVWPASTAPPSAAAVAAACANTHAEECQRGRKPRTHAPTHPHRGSLSAPPSPSTHAHAHRRARHASKVCESREHRCSAGGRRVRGL